MLSPLYHRLLGHFHDTLPGRGLSAQCSSLVPEIRLYLVDGASMDQPLNHDEAQAVVAEPAYWSFSWASGQVLARWILDHPEAVAGKRLVDVGSGSGLVALAAARAGASEVWACDVDAGAGLAIQANAALNHLSVTWVRDWGDLEEVDVITAADILYDRENLPLLQAFRTRASEVWLADSRIRDLAVEGFQLAYKGEGLTWPDLGELAEFRQVTVYRSSQ